MALIFTRTKGHRGTEGWWGEKQRGWGLAEAGSRNTPPPRGLVLQRPGTQIAHPNWTPLVTPSNFHSKGSFNTGKRAFKLNWELEEAKRGKGRRISPWMTAGGPHS